MVLHSRFNPIYAADFSSSGCQKLSLRGVEQEVRFAKSRKDGQSFDFISKMRSLRFTRDAKITFRQSQGIF